MAFVLRLSVAGRQRSWCTSSTSSGANYDLVSLPLSRESVLLGAISEFGDLASYVGLSQACQLMHRQLMSSLGFVDDRETSLACSRCSGYGDDRPENCVPRISFPCDLCWRTVVCEDCVVLASFDGNALYPTSWVCSHCHKGFDTVPSLRSWLFDVVAKRMFRVYLVEYHFYFWVQFVALSGEALRDEHNSPCSGLRCLWGSSFDHAWFAVNYRTGGREVAQMVFGTVVVDAMNKSRLRWSDFVSRAAARAYEETSPLQVTVVLDGY